MSSSIPGIGSLGVPVESLPADNLNIFGGMNVDSPVNVLDFKHIDSLNPELIFDLRTGGAATVLDAPNAAAQMSVPAAVSKNVRQTRYLNYQSGKPMRIIFTAVPFLTAPPSGVKWQAGFFNAADDKDMGSFPNQYPDGDGLFFQYFNGWSFVNRSSASGAEVDDPILQADWNIDKLDGSGPSGMTLDPTKLNIFWIEFGWLSTLGFRFGVYDNLKRITCHEEEKTNESQSPYMQRGTLPINYRLENTTGGAPTASRMVCGTAESLGGYDPTGVQYTQKSGTATITSNNGVPTTLLAIRLKQGFNRRSFLILKNAFLSTTNGNVICEVLVNPTTVTPGPWLDVGDGSGMEYSTGTEFNLATGRIQNTDYISNDSDRVVMKPDSIFMPSSNIEGESDIFVLASTAIGQNEEMLASCTWKEFI